jgi:DNA polymerase
LSFCDRVHDCQACQGLTPLLFTDRKVISRSTGEGPCNIFIIGEAPGQQEYSTGVPFVGASGQLLQHHIDRYNLSCYITNTIKCRPEGNADPSITQKDNCRDFLRDQLYNVNPKVVVTLGKHATSSIQYLFTPLHDDNYLFDYNGTSRTIIVRSTYHPAYLLYNRNNTELYYAYDTFFKSLGDIV